MAAPLRSTPHPASHTAPVAEFRCLYTPDVRKKQKKWQDGYLKFHAFNSRVMVYDHARNFLGDTYYKDSTALHEGDELTLDKGVLVEVADAMGVTQTDLAPLFEKKPRDGPPPAPRRFQPPSQVAARPPSNAARPTSNAARPTSNAARPTSNAAHPTSNAARHKSLNTLLGTPRGPIGKSVPVKSPYEARQEQERDKENAAEHRAAKRLKTTHGCSPTLRLSSPVREESPAPRNNLPLWPKSSAKMPRKPAKPNPRGAPINTLDELDAPAITLDELDAPAITLDELDAPAITLDKLDAPAHASSDASLPSTPPGVTSPTARPAMTPASTLRPAVFEKPVLQTPRIPRGKVPVPSVKAVEAPQPPAPASSPPVSASNRLTNVDFAIQPTPAKESIRRPPKQPSPPRPVESPQSPPRNPRAKSLRLSKGVKRGTLMMCQFPPPSRSVESSEARVMAAKPKTAKNVAASRQDTSQTLRTVKNPAVASGDALLPTSKRKATTNKDEARKIVKSRHKSPEENLDILDDDQEVVHGLMDQQLLLSGTPPPEPILAPGSPEPVLSKTNAAEPAARNTRKASPSKPKQKAPFKVVSSPAQVSNVAEPSRKSAHRTQQARKSSPPVAALVEAVQTESRAASPALSVVSESRSPTTSLSPRKFATLSTGGFRKRTKRATPQPITPAPENPLAAPRSETVALPPHPLRASKKGPVMTTTELAAMLQKPKKKAKAPVHLVEDGGEPARISPERKFRRVRSENDASIPNTSEDWEKRNLAKAAATLPSISLDIESNVAKEAPEARKKSGLAALIKKTDPRKKFVRTQSLTVETTMPPSQEMESPMVSPTVDKDIGPWSTEAFDLFDWRPSRKDMET